MTNEYGEYLNYKITHSKTYKEREYYQQLAAIADNNEYQYTNPHTQSVAYVPISQQQYNNGNNYNNNYGNNNSSSNYINNKKYQDIVPTTVNNDPDLQDALKGNIYDNEQEGIRDLNLEGPWRGMESGAIKYNSTQSPNWLNNVPLMYRKKALEWSNNQGILEIIPLQQRQKFTYSTIPYIARHTAEPKTQRIPISDVSVVPHQINFDFYDTTEGRIGVSHATEKHMSVEFDVYLTDYIFFNWNFGENNVNKYYINVPERIKKIFWQAINEKNYIDKNMFTDIEQTKDFTDFRMSFLQQHLGWMCKFNTHVFPSFSGVINDVSYLINNGESFAKWHIKIEETLFTKDAAIDGQKPAESTTSDNGSTTTSGAADDIENIEIG